MSRMQNTLWTLGGWGHVRLFSKALGVLRFRPLNRITGSGRAQQNIMDETWEKALEKDCSLFAIGLFGSTKYGKE